MIETQPPAPPAAETVANEQEAAKTRIKYQKLLTKMQWGETIIVDSRGLFIVRIDIPCPH